MLKTMAKAVTLSPFKQKSSILILNSIFFHFFNFA